MSDEPLDQNEIERLLGGGDNTPSPDPQPPADDANQEIDQAAIEALMAGAAGKPASGDNAANPSDPADDDSPLQQNEIEALLGGAGEKAPPKSKLPVDDSPLQQDEIEALLGGGGGKSSATPSRMAKPAASAAPAPSPQSAHSPAAAANTTAQAMRGGQSPGSIPTHGTTPPPVSLGSDVNVLLEQAERAIASIDHPVSGNAEALPFDLADFSGSTPSLDRTSLDLLRDVELELKIELGRTRMPLEEMMKLKSGAVVALDKLAGDPVDIYVNGRMIARGEVLVFNDNFCVRVAELISGDNA